MEHYELIFQRPNKKIYRDGNQKLKMFSDRYPESDILNEALNQVRVEEALRSTAIKAPKLVEVAIYDEKWTIVSEFIEGKTLEAYMAENPEDASKHLQRFVEIQVELGRVSAPLLTPLLHKMHRKIDRTQLEDTIREELHRQLAAMPVHDKLCHGDFHPSNIIITPDDAVCVIDWSHVTRGNLSADAARTYLSFLHHKGRSVAEEYLALFCKCSGSGEEYVKRWVPLVAAASIEKSGDEQETRFLYSCI